MELGKTELVADMRAEGVFGSQLPGNLFGRLTRQPVMLVDGDQLGMLDVGVVLQRLLLALNVGFSISD